MLSDEERCTIAKRLAEDDFARWVVFRNISDIPTAKADGLPDS